MTKTKNERNTENVVRDLFQQLGYKDNPNIVVEEQKSENPAIQKLLQNASKSGKGIGKPEFIVRHTDYPDFIIVVECKADIKFHQSKTLDKYKDYSVDGVLNYASYLSKSFNVIALAISGQEEKNILISSFLWVRSAPNFDEFVSPDQTAITEILPFEKYVNFANYDHKIEKSRFEDLISFSKDLHNYMRDYAKLSETEKPLLVSGILIALRNRAFSISFRDYKQKTELAKRLLDAIEDVIEEADIPKAKKQNMRQPYSFIMVHPELSKVGSTGETPLYRLLNDIDEHVKPFISVYHNFDVIGQFYGEFLRYTGGDKKGLGIVLTPKHITELFSKIANLTPKTAVLDTCAGTSGFLIASMFEMIKKAKTDDEKLHIKKHCLIGVEQQPNMYALASSNMILRGDGKANLYQGSCFDEAITKEISNRAEVGMINPPYSQKGEGLHELDFVNHLLNCLKPNGITIAVVPMSCAISPHPMRDKILQNHRLDAVMSLPDDVFYPIGVVTCIMVFTAHVPHEQNPLYKSWFGYWKNDGYIKTKTKGRIDAGNWKSIEQTWLDGFFNRSEVAGLSVLKKVTSNDEWCGEAYMETDYSELSEIDFVEAIKKYALFKIKGI
jgi:type I restriction enzyme M protein